MLRETSEGSKEKKGKGSKVRQILNIENELSWWPGRFTVVGMWKALVCGWSNHLTAPKCGCYDVTTF